MPHNIQEHVDYITPGIKLVAPPRKQPNLPHEQHGIEKRVNKNPPLTKPLPLSLTALLALPLQKLCGAAITPVCISTLYNITKPTTAVKGNQLGIFEDLGDHYSPTDLTEFFTTLAPQIPIFTRPENRLIDGAFGPAKSVLTAGPESDLDFQISYPVIYPQQSVLFQTDDEPTETNCKFQHVP